MTSRRRVVAAPRRHVLVVNQHGDNTGDEAALRAMLDGLAQRLGPVRFTVLHQFREASSCIETTHDVEWVRLLTPLRDVPGLALIALSPALAGVARRLSGPSGRAIIDAYASADLVVSAPGGPYFGDPYWNHEPLHWAYVWLARRHGRPLGLYATSAGPFDIRPFNPFRRLTYRCFDRLVLREQVSASLVRELTRGRLHVEVTADSALQARVAPLALEQWSSAPPPPHAVIVAVAAIDRPYTGDADPAGRRANYDRSVVAAVSALADSSPQHLHVVLVPQLQSAAHDDAPYLERLGRALPDGVTFEVAGAHRSSDVQRGIFAAADVVVAGRYHPAVFAVSAGVPVLAIPYEHKAAGLMEAAGLGEFCVDLDDVSPELLATIATQLWQRRDEVREHLQATEPQLRALAARTSDLMAQLVLDPGGRGAGTAQVPAKDA
jgi:colanic acid/amylovoran biosynthesis protein